NLARELHDQIGQALTAIKINLSALKFHTEKSDFNALIERNIDAADRAIEQVRNLSLNLRPSVLDDLGLVAALRWYAHSQAALTGMSINFNADEIEMRPSPDIETVFFRVAQEAFTNVLRHAQAQQIQIHLTQDDENLIMQISDDGVGFDVEAALRKAGAGASMGLLNIQERSELVGGILEIKSQPGEGSSIILRLPHEGQPNSQVRKP
ncbi:MAG: sensor histidine kinase, partial [Chloroflexi bacterium]|nr:sensor histidine kinase [Chloroflexota bacterium]